MRPPFRGGRGGDSDFSEGGGGGFRGGGRGGYGGRVGGGYLDESPSEEVIEICTFCHACEGEAVTKIPYCNAPIYLEHKSQIKKVEEISCPNNDAHISAKLQDGVIATSLLIVRKT